MTQNGKSETESAKVVSIEALLEKPSYRALGFSGQSYYYYAESSKNVVKIAAFSKTDFLGIMPLGYWAANFPKLDKKDDVCGVAWDAAQDKLIRQAIAAGAFNAQRVRGTGVWLDEGKTVINTGDSLIVDGVNMPMNRHKSYYCYIQTANRMPPLAPVPLDKSEGLLLLDICRSFKWEDSKSGDLLAGWLMIARIAGGLPIRPHVWITGKSGSGKSTIMDQVVRPALGSPAAKIYVQGGTTEAGLRQAVKADSLPVIFDEFETASNNERQNSIVELLRQCWSATEGYILKGTADGTAMKFALSFAALVASIRVNMENDADRSRFTVMELSYHGDDSEHWDKLLKKIGVITQEYGERLFARAVDKIGVILESYGQFQRALMATQSARFSQQYGMLLAGAWTLTHDFPPGDLAAEHVAMFDWGASTENAISDEYGCLIHILTQKIRYSEENVDDMGRVSVHHFEASIGDIIMNGSVSAKKECRRRGVSITDEKIYIAGKHAELQKIFRDTHWKDWMASLKRLDCYEGYKTARFEKSVIHSGVLDRDRVVMIAKEI